MERLTCKGLRLCHDFQGKFELPTVEYYNRLAELEDKIEDGELIELPCKIGTEIFEVLPLAIMQRYSLSTISYIVRKMPFDYRHIPHWNKTVFADKETAEKVCKDMNIAESQKREEHDKQFQKKRSAK